MQADYWKLSIGLCNGLKWFYGHVVDWRGFASLASKLMKKCNKR